MTRHHPKRRTEDATLSHPRSPVRSGDRTDTKLSCLLVLVLGLSASLPAHGAQREQGAPTGYAITSWSEKDGLPSPPIFTIVQDRDGYLWLGSSAGLVRFDGERFVRWETPEG